MRAIQQRFDPAGILNPARFPFGLPPFAVRRFIAAFSSAMAVDATLKTFGSRGPRPHRTS